MMERSGLQPDMIRTVHSDEPDDLLFRQLFAEHFDDLWRFARRRCRSSADADDITAQVFAVAWRRRGELPEVGTRLWLFGVARLTLANHHRSTGRRQRLLQRIAGNRTIDYPSSPVATTDDDRLADRLGRLSDADFDLISMRYWDNLPVQDIAALLDCTPNAVSMRLHKVRRRLQAELSEKDPGPDGHVKADPTQRKEADHGNE